MFGWSYAFSALTYDTNFTYPSTAPITPIPPPTTIPGDFTETGDTDGNPVNIYDYNLLVGKFNNPYTIGGYNNLVTNFGK